MNIVVRIATAHDVASVSRIAAETFALACPPQTDPNDIEAHLRSELSPARFHRHRTDERSTLLVADLDGECAGYALMRDCDPDEVPGTGALRQLYVRPPFHLRGVGRALTATVFSTAAKRGWGRIRLTVSKENGRAVAFYRKIGFAVVGETQFEVGSEVHEDFVMTMNIERSAAPPSATFDAGP